MTFPNKLRSGVLYIQQGYSAYVPVLMRSTLDHASAMTGLSLNIYLSINGVALSQVYFSYTDNDSGWYSIQLPALYTQIAGSLLLSITSPGADPSYVTCEIYESMFDKVPDQIASDLSFASKVSQKLLTLRNFLSIL